MNKKSKKVIKKSSYTTSFIGLVNQQKSSKRTRVRSKTVGRTASKKEIIYKNAFKEYLDKRRSPPKLKRVVPSSIYQKKISGILKQKRRNRILRII
mmetsp:Transcript_7560/g.6693  ORF Transcript_7560/g.6693 Transcript_7560/m.6693 type:complete len:96 (-) Transcript_7560:105-392(-)